ncbi:Lrp/AsnC family transcriptional regulator [Microbaculum marinisediminis]|uniref:Lrp/AsnC family transcriptional regulator n=1 Tax=Microbaculum marinisediminis TaxID=2931392 RepID=A0AAW5QV93_9HYPH|nr:Lrp/AsnC family transcriptional regulator [Microbaculum sp. A6E488]MCT8970471.1 Lrp/AsnC family transcriptional regulator [Microbaculum sp. A6E488]
MDIDAIDLRILDALQEKGDLTNQGLAERVHLSASQVSRRRARLEQDGVIRRYRAELDGERLGLSTVVFIHVTLSRHNAANARRFRDLAAMTPEVQEAYALTGEADYLLKVVVASLPDLARFVNDVLLPHESVSQVRSEVVLETLSERRSLPIVV